MRTGFVTILMVFGGAALAEPSIIAPASGSIGRNLEAFTAVRLSEVAPHALDVTITSDDPKRLLLSKDPVAAGAASISLRVNAQYPETPDFYLQAFGDSGSVTYTVTAPGYNPAKGSIKLAPSAILVMGPFRAPEFRTTTGTAAKITLVAAQLDADGNAVQQQPIAGGLKVSVGLSTSDPRVGAFEKSKLVLAGGDDSATTAFQPAGVGRTILRANAPSGFSTSAKSSVTAIVDLPGIGITGEIFIGRDLQVTAFVLLGEPAPPGGLEVKLTSADPGRLLLSDRVDQPGSGSVLVRVPAGEQRAPYYIQALADSGIVNYSAVANGYRSRVARVSMAPSGVMVVYAPYGAPDEAEVLRRNLTVDPRPFTVSLSERKPTPLAVWTVYLDPATRRGADMTAQRLRPGVFKTIELKSSNPTVGRVPPSVTLTCAAPYTVAEFTAMAAGQTVISVSTPSGFLTPSNAASVTATVKAE